MSEPEDGGAASEGAGWLAEAAPPGELTAGDASDGGLVADFNARWKKQHADAEAAAIKVSDGSEVVGVAGAVSLDAPSWLQAAPAREQPAQLEPEEQLAEHAEEEHDDEVSQWLVGLGLQKYAAAFREAEIDMDTLPFLGSSDLFQLGFEALGPRRKVMSAIANLTAQRRQEQQEQRVPDLAAGGGGGGVDTDAGSESVAAHPWQSERRLSAAGESQRTTRQTLLPGASGPVFAIFTAEGAAAASAAASAPKQPKQKAAAAPKPLTLQAMARGGGGGGSPGGGRGGRRWGGRCDFPIKTTDFPIKTTDSMLAAAAAVHRLVEAAAVAEVGHRLVEAAAVHRSFAVGTASGSPVPGGVSLRARSLSSMTLSPCRRQDALGTSSRTST